MSAYKEPINKISRPKQARPRKRKTLPLLKPEYMPGLAIFALRYFEAVYQSLSAPMVLVIDNYQLIPPESILHSPIFNGLSVIPDGLTAILISRENPPPTFSRMLANREMIHIGWNQVQLTQEETAGIARLQTEKSISEATIHQLHKAAGGWTAGLMLMLAHADLEGIDWQWIQGFNSQEMFDYFGKEVFESETPEIQAFLLRASLLPHMTINMAETFTGHPLAGQILSVLNRSNRFTERRFQERLSYQFHPLFREFLLSRFKEKYSEKELVNLCRTAARLLQDEGHIEEAVALLRDAKEWDVLATLIINYAPTLLRQGRNHTLLAWLGFLPKEMISEDPWLGYWMGTALTSFDPQAGRTLLEKAFETFQSQNDVDGLFLSWSGIIKAIFLIMTDFSPFDRWIQVLEDLMAEYRQFPSKEIEGHVVAGMLMALGHRQMHHPNIKFWVDRALSLLAGPLDLNIKVSLINHAAHYYLLTGNYSKAAQIMDLQGPSTLSGHMEPKDAIANVAFSTISSFYYCYVGMHEKCLDVVSKSLELSRKTEFLILDNIIAGYGIEEEYIAEYVRKRCLIPDPPPVHLENWPWPLKIFTLGQFSIIKEGGPIRFSTKAQKKPLEMIKVLIAFGGRNVSKASICDSRLAVYCFLNRHEVKKI